MNNDNKTNINWFPGHVAKARREIKEKMKFIDVVYEVIDSRMPISSKVADINDIIKDKKRILIATKYDMCDKKETDKLLDTYKEKGYYIYKCDLLHDNMKGLLTLTNDIMTDSYKKMEDKGLKARTPRVLVIGVPNCGKSTLINRLAGSKKAPVGNKPGFTKTLSWIRLSNIELLDTPGILWPKFENQEQAKKLVALSSIKNEIVDPFLISNYILNTIYKLYPDYLNKRYEITSLSEDLLSEYEIIGKRRGALISKGEVDYLKVSNIITRDLQDGLLGPVTLDRIENE